MEDFSATLMALEERVGALIEMANRLVYAGHYSSNTVQERRDMVVQAREKLKVNNTMQRAVLDEYKLFQKFRTEVGEMNNFVTSKRKLVREDSFRDGIGDGVGGRDKIQCWQMKVPNRTGQQMVQRNHLKAKEIGEELAGVNIVWERLVEVVKERGSNLVRLKPRMIRIQ